MAGGPGLERLLGAEGRKTVDALGPAEAIVGVCALNQARSVGQVVEAAAAGLSTALAGRAGAVLVVDAGFREQTREIIGAWAAGRSAGPPVRCVRISGPPNRSRAVLAVLAAAHHLQVPACALVDAGLTSLTSEGIVGLLQPLLAAEADCVGPAYTHTVAEGTLTTNLLAPMCRALYGLRIQQLLGGCAGLSERLAARLVEAEARHGDAADHDLEIRLTLEAIAGGDRIREVHMGRKILDAGLAPPDLATTVARAVGPFFRAMERYRTLWQDVRGSTPVQQSGDPPAVLSEAGDIQLDRMVRAFKLGLKDLLPIWEQAFQEETLAGLYPLGLLAADEFEFPVSLWARLICDAAVAYHEHRLPHDHLLRALTPLYLGRVAGFLRETQLGPSSRIPEILEGIGQAFEAEKEGLRARWR
jgi:glucosylglycerate synthase